MRIQNLGSIKDGQVYLNRLTVLTGNNGTGKTLAAYSLFAFRYWLENRFTPRLVTASQIEQIMQGEPLTNSAADYLSQLEQQLIADFNQLNDSETFYQDFFRDSGVYVKGKTKLTIDEQDIAMLKLPTHKRMSWLYRWRYNWGPDEANDRHIGDTSTENQIVSEYATKTGKITTYYRIFGAAQGQQEVRQTVDLQQAAKIVSENIYNDLFATRKVSFYMPAERIGINVFRNRLNNQIVSDSFQAPATSAEVDEMPSGSERYPYPIEAYIKYINESLGVLSEPIDKNGQDKQLQAMLADLIPGEFAYNTAKNEISYQLPDGGEATQITFNLLSSSLKSLFGIDIFIRHIGQGNWLFIDEPEMNLHPTRQVMMMAFLYQLATLGTNIVISTHSDYLVKELMNLMLADKVAQKSMPSLVSVYNFAATTIKDLGDITAADVDLTNFDATTDKINDRYYELMDQLQAGGNHEA